MFQFIKKNRGKALAIAIVIILIIIIVGKKPGSDEAITHVVIREDVSDKLTLSGKVEPVDRVEMAFVTSGIVDRVFKQNGDSVRSGEKIIELDNSSLRADLSEATVGTVAREQDLLVANAYKRLLNDDLEAYLVSDGDDDLSATVSGSYQGDEEGVYNLKAYASGASSGFSLKISGLENGSAPVTFNSPVAIGTRGLYIKFEDSGVSYNGSSWVLEIPNKRSASYVSNLNAYESAKKTREIALAETSAKVAGINADIEARVLRAPFDGIVSKVDIKKGEIAASGIVVATVMSRDAYQVKVQVPEVDIVNMVPGLVANVTLDAYGKDVIFPARVLSVDRSETKVDGVSVYEAKVVFDEIDSRILSGMTANIEIIKARASNVVVIPESFIQTDDTGKFVMVLGEEEELIKSYVVTGLKGTNGNIEIESGVSEGSTIIGNFKK